MTKRNENASPGVRLRALKRDKFKCSYCGRTGQEAELEVDHIIPVSKGGSHHVSNLTTACRECNQGKGNTDIKPPGGVISKPKGDDPLIGMFLHTLEIDRDDPKRIKFGKQGVITGVNDRFAVVQLFGWGWGNPIHVEMIPLDDIANSEKVRLYASNEAMVYAETARMARHGELSGTVEENMECWRSMREAWRKH